MYAKSFLKTFQWTRGVQEKLARCESCAVVLTHVRTPNKQVGVWRATMTCVCAGLSVWLAGRPCLYQPPLPRQVRRIDFATSIHAV